MKVHVRIGCGNLLQRDMLNIIRKVRLQKDITLSQKRNGLFVSAKNNNFKIGKNIQKVKKAPTINKRTLDHEIKVAEVLNHILRFNDNLSIDDFKTERDMQRKMEYMQIRNQHICDLLCEKYKIKIEVELSVKQKNKLSRNIIFNTSNYVQIWFVNSDMLYKRLLDEKNIWKRSI